jgi:transcriptional regulator with XRE-family HTH domain
LPCLPITLKALKPKEPDFEPQTLGEHIRKRRLELKLSQKAAGERLGVNAFTVFNWEKGKTEPPVTVMPAIVGFLGYRPYSEPVNLAERLTAARRLRGWTIKKAARELGVDVGTWGAWELKGSIPWKRYQRMVEDFLTKICQ